MNHLLTDQNAAQYTTETYTEFAVRYGGFGKEIYDTLRQRLPHVFSALCLYKNTVWQTEDSYAVYENGRQSFGIQLDPLCEVVVLWNESVHVEIGYWSANVYDESVEFIQTHFLSIY